MIQVVIPFIGPDYLLDGCLESMGDSDLVNVMVVDNRGENIGIAASWNKGLDQGRDWTLVLSAAMRFPTGIHALAEKVMAQPLGYGLRLEPHAFHAFIVGRSLVDTIGKFDDKFYPMECEDADYRYRMKLAGIDYYDLPKLDNDLECVGNTIAGKLGLVPKSSAPIERYVKKWGGFPNEETLTEPAL